MFGDRLAEHGLSASEISEVCESLTLLIQGIAEDFFKRKDMKGNDDA